MLLFLATMLFASIAMVGLAVAQRQWDDEQTKELVDRRLESVTGPKPTGPTTVFKDQRFSGFQFLNNFLARASFAENLTRSIRQAGLSKRVGEVVLYIPLLACLAFLAVEIFGLGHPLAVMAAFLGGMTPIFVIQRMRNKRTAHFTEQLPDALDLVGSALRSGHALAGGFAIIAEEFPDPIAQEFRDVTDELRVGLSMREALENLTGRVNDRNLPILVVAILIAMETGGNMAEVLANTSHTIRDRFRLLRDIEAMTAQGRLSGNVLTALPLIVGGMMWAVNTEYFEPMITTSAGNYMLMSAGVMIVLAHFMIKKIVTLDV